MALYGTVELGGTKTLVSSGTTAEDLAEPHRLPTTKPDEVLAAVIDHLSGQPIASLGVASFGPLELRADHPDYGSISATPKPGWANTPILRVLSEALDLPVSIDTDVNGAALGEGVWGAGRGLHELVYVTVGTGIGGGVVVGGSPLGALGHPEIGHIEVERLGGDTYPGRCPYHGGCLEGMASGPAIEDRFGPHESWEDPSPPRDTAAFYVAQGVRNLIYTLAPQRVIVGGGVSKIPGFHARLRTDLVRSLAGYPGLEEHTSDAFVVAPGLGDHSGLVGGLVLAAGAVA